jgi:hypothetical protein
VEHGLRTDEALGDCAARLLPLAERDLEGAPHLVARLVAAIQAAAPRGAQAPLPAASAERLGHLMAAVSGTHTAEVRELLEALAARFEGQELGQRAEDALLKLASPASSATPGATLTGDLHVFGLPTVLQSLSTSRVRGTLSLVGPGQTPALIAIEGGRITSALFANLSGADAVYQLLERPFAGKYSFTHRTDTVPGPLAPGALDATPTILEGMRRHDELRRASLLVPDEATLEATGHPPSAVPEEHDVGLVTALWEKASAGATPASGDETLDVDSFRVRRALVHWLEEGALRLRRT